MPLGVAHCNSSTGGHIELVHCAYQSRLIIIIATYITAECSTVLNTGRGRGVNKIEET